MNFTALALPRRLECSEEKLLTQSQFLMGIGETSQFADAFEECRLPKNAQRLLFS